MNNEVTFICDICKDKSFDLMRKSKNYCRVSSLEASFVCVECLKIFSMAYEVTDKEVNCSIKSERISCSEQSRKQQENETILSKEYQHKRYKCNICGATYKSIQNLYQHKNIHKERFKCTTCSKCSKNKNELIIHMQKHSKEIPHKCSVCSKTFKYLSSLKDHMNVHNKSNPFRCKMCEKDCISRYNLRQHMRTHSNERPYKCSICNATYKSIFELRRHIKKHKK